MNRAFIHIERDGDGLYQGKATYTAVVADDYVEDILIDFLAEPEFLQRAAADIALFVAGKDGEALDVISAAAMNGSPLYVNGRDADLEVLKAGFPAPAST